MGLSIGFDSTLLSFCKFLSFYIVSCFIVVFFQYVTFSSFLVLLFLIFYDNVVSNICPFLKFFPFFCRFL